MEDKVNSSKKYKIDVTSCSFQQFSKFSFFQGSRRRRNWGCEFLETLGNRIGSKDLWEMSFWVNFSNDYLVLWKTKLLQAFCDCFFD